MMQWSFYHTHKTLQFYSFHVHERYNEMGIFRGHSQIIIYVTNILLNLSNGKVKQIKMLHISGDQY